MLVRHLDESPKARSFDPARARAANVEGLFAVEVTLRRTFCTWLGEVQVERFLRMLAMLQKHFPTSR